MSATLTQLLANAFKGAAVSVALTSNAGTATTPGTEITGSGYARQTPSWGTPTAASPSVLTGTASFTVPAGVTVAGFNVYDGSGNFLTGGASTSATSGAASTYALTITSQSKDS